MDDIRRPQHLKRRDYAIPAGRAPAAQSQPNPVHRPHQHTPQHTQPIAHQQPVAHSPAMGAPGYMQQPPYQTPHNRPHTPDHQSQLPHPNVQHLPSRQKHRTRLLSGKKLSLAIAVVIAAAAIFGAGYLLKGSSDSKGIPASITRQVNYDLYFPSPMPRGYIYMKDTATFQIGQVFYKFSNGKKRVTVNEQPMTDPKPNLAKLPGYKQFQSPAGPAAIGMELGEPTAVILTPTTVITMHCVGGVSPNDLRSAIDNLKNIGQNNQKT